MSLRQYYCTHYYFSNGLRPLSHARRVMARNALIASLENRPRKFFKGAGVFE
jgi:hypothetical protein